MRCWPYRQDAKALGVIADTQAILVESDLERLLSKLLELALTIVNAEIGCVAYFGEADSWQIDVTLGLQPAHVDELTSCFRLTHGRIFAQ